MPTIQGLITKDCVVQKISSGWRPETWLDVQKEDRKTEGHADSSDPLTLCLLKPARDGAAAYFVAMFVHKPCQPKANGPPVDRVLHHQNVILVEIQLSLPFSHTCEVGTDEEMVSRDVLHSVVLWKEHTKVSHGLGPFLNCSCPLPITPPPPTPTHTHDDDDMGLNVSDVGLTYLGQSPTHTSAPFYISIHPLWGYVAVSIISGI